MSDYTEVVPTPECRDKLGALITVGSVIVYGTLLGRCAALKIGRVTKIRAVKSKWSSYKGHEWRIHVRGVEDGWAHATPKAGDREGVLQFPNRALVIEPEKLPDSYRQLLFLDE